MGKNRVFDDAPLLTAITQSAPTPRQLPLMEES